ncbi:LAGLIDADG family homing endonuclease [Natronomonas marina]|uniref:LAGLIDADG family homing endonuclease n=1 Tax=Natronomonas marina TaxID=2961939 RepID=UPI0020C99EB0|nr:LAGLIDADG family homing endonuclease [Natronomonas marina]
MARAEDTEVIDKFEQFYRDYYRNEIGELAQKYPNEQRSLYVDWGDLYRFDPDLADDLVAQPEQMRDYAEEALRLYDLPVDVKLGQAHVRVQNLQETTAIRDIRARHRGQLIAVTGIVRKATDVRPKVTEAAFECQRCGTLTRIPQTSGEFYEPHECQGCERQGPFEINFDQSEFVDAQKLRVQESPEGLRGGETPQSIDVHIDDDITGKVTAGDHVRVTGILHLDQQGSDQDKSPIFDVYMDGIAVEIEDEQFEDMDITDEDKKEIIELSNSGDIYEQMVNSIAPSIYGYRQEKLAMMLQLFSGVTKHLPDGSRIRGDLHMLLIGDPGTGKCVKGDTRVTLADGRERRIGPLVEEHLEDPSPIDDGVYDEVDIELPSLDADGTIARHRATTVWKREAPDRMYRIRTASGKQLEVTPSHPLFTQSGGQIRSVEADDLTEGEFVAVPRSIPTTGDDTLDVDYRQSRANNAVRLDPPAEWTPWLGRFIGYVIAEGHVDVDDGNSADIRVTNEDSEIISDVTEALDRLGVNYTVVNERENKSARVVRCGSSELASFLEAIEPAVLKKSADQRVPAGVLEASVETKRAFLRAYVDAEGHVSATQREVTVVSMSRDLLEGVESLLLAVGVSVSIESRHNGSYRLRISGHDYERYVERVGFVTNRKSAAAGSFDDVSGNPNLDVVPNVGSELESIRKALALPQSDCGLPRSTYQHYERGDRNPSRESLQQVVERFDKRLQWLEETRSRIRNGDWDDIESVRAKLDISQRDLADRMGVEQTAVSYYERNDVVPDGGSAASARAAVLERIERGLAAEEGVESLKRLAGNDIRWDRIETIETIQPDYDWVYDLEVPGTHSYVSNNVLSHNSAMLQYIRNVAPRSVYTSGKGSSSAGLTAAAVRDDFGDGQQWTLEAGALVLADQGIAAVDELDKMRCVAGDTLVHLADGRVSRIRALAREAARTGTIEDLPNGRTIRDTDLRVWTMTDDGRLVDRPVTAIHEYDAPTELTRVSLESGESVTATDDHPFFVFEDGNRAERPASDLEPGDWVYVPADIPTSVADGGTAATTAPERTEPLPTATAFGAVLGYLSGDGNVYYDSEAGSYGIRFTNKERELLEDFERACRDAFDAEPVRYPSEQRDDGVGTVRLHGREYADAVLDAGMNLETYDRKAFPHEVSEGCRETKAAFVRAMADSEGTVDTSAGNVRIHSASEELLRGLKSLLLEFGISCQLRSRDRKGKLDLYVLNITAADSLRAYDRHIGFGLKRKQSALEEVRAAVDGDRTILDVLPDCGELLYELRESLRLYQSECGLDDATYCTFENGDANLSLHRGRTVLERFEARVERATVDEETLSTQCDWKTLEELKRRYNVSQRELAADSAHSQQEISRRWGDDEELREYIRRRLEKIVEDVARTDVSPLADLVDGDVKWRRVADVETVDSEYEDDRIPVLHEELASLVGCESDSAEQRARELLDPDVDTTSWTGLREALECHGVPLGRIATELDVAESTVSRWFNGLVETDRFEDVRAVAEQRMAERRDEIGRLLAEIEYRRTPKVYDLTVEGTHNFVANSAVVHNSEDRSAMHEALEQQSISVSKAGINATLKSRCSLLGAANPKYGRFDQYEPIGEQIDLEPALISRFDLIFTVTDQPDEEEDANLAEHIINTNYAGELHTHRENTATSNVTQEEVDNVTEDVEPDIDSELLRKYIAYAKRNCFPTMTEEAKKEIRDFYVDLRAKGQDEDAPVPVTARKLEALVRLSEASARMRLSDTVEAEDASRVIDIVRSCLQDIGVDPETGEFDADVVETGQSKSQRDRIKNIKTLISEVEEEYDEGAPREEVLDRAEETGMERSKAEHEIEKLRQKGDVYEPQTDHLRTV